MAITTSGGRGRSIRRSTSISWLVPRVFSLLQYGAREVFLRGDGKKWWVPSRGKRKCLFLKGVSFKGVSLHFYGISLFLRKRLISTAEVYFYEGGIFLRRRHISTTEAYFYGGGTFLRQRCISTAEIYFYGGGTFLRRRCISTKKVYFYERGQFKSNRLITCMEKRDQCTWATVNFQFQDFRKINKENEIMKWEWWIFVSCYLQSCFFFATFKLFLVILRHSFNTFFFAKEQDKKRHFTSWICDSKTEMKVCYPWFVVCNYFGPWTVSWFLQLLHC